MVVGVVDVGGGNDDFFSSLRHLINSNVLSHYTGRVLLS